MNFEETIKKCAQEFSSLQKIKVISHYDSDGLSSAALMIKTLDLLEKDYSLTIVSQLTHDLLSSIAKEPYNNFVFLDLGSGSLTDIEELFTNKKVFILDHHKPQGETQLFHINPHDHGIDGGTEISGSGVTYLFCKELTPKITHIAAVAYIGIVGDMQDKQLASYNNKILEEALSNNSLIKTEEGFSLFDLDIKEFSTLLNACGRMGKPGLGVGACLDKNTLLKAKDCLADYKEALMRAMRWVTNSKGTAQVIEKDNYMVINAKDKIPVSIIGTISSMICHSLPENYYVVGMARSDYHTKISIRTSQKKEVNLQDLMKKVITQLGSGEYGGHDKAAGGTIPLEQEEQFIAIITQLLSKKRVEENIT